MRKATRKQTRAHNNRLVLQTIYNRGEVSRAEIARLTDLTPVTVSDIVSDLVDEGVISEVGVGPSAGGKPPILLSVNDDARSLIGIDLANSEFRGAVVNLRGEIKHRVSFPIDDQDGDAALLLVYKLIDLLVAAAKSPVLGIGIGTPGLMDAENGVVRKAVNLDWHNLHLKDLLEERYDLPVFIANDSQVAALAEMSFGNGKDVSNLIVIKVGRGISAGIVLNRRLYYGDDSGAGEIGHVSIIENGEQCLCGNYGCLETIVSSRAAVKQANAIAKNDPESIFNKLVKSPEEISTKVLLQAFEEGDESIATIVHEMGLTLGKVVAHLVGAFNIRHIVIAGSMARFGEALAKPLQEQVRRNALKALADNTQIQISNLGNDIVILGSAALLLQQVLGLT